jgi:small multidrug resistance pump
MDWIIVAVICATVAVNASSQILLKLGASKGMINLYVLLGIMGYGIGTVLYLYILKRLELSVAYPVVIGSTLITTTIASVFVLKEPISLTQWLGVALLVSGLIAVSGLRLSN